MERYCAGPDISIYRPIKIYVCVWGGGLPDTLLLGRGVFIINMR